jgi:hypothetical protein
MSETESILSQLNNEWEKVKPEYNLEMIENIPRIKSILINQLHKTENVIGELLKKDRFYYREISYIKDQLAQYQTEFLAGYKVCEDTLRDRTLDFILERELLEDQKTKNMLLFIFKYLPGEYAKVCNQSSNPVLLWPYFHQWKEEKSLRNVELLSQGMRGYYVSYTWNLIYDVDDESGLVLLLQTLRSEERWEMSGRILENLFRSKYSTMYIHVSKKEKDSYWYDKTLHSLKVWGMQEEWIQDTLADHFLRALTGRVNRESWLAAIHLIKELEGTEEGLANKNAGNLTELILSHYPHFWKSNGGDGQYFGGKQSLELISELSFLFLRRTGQGAFKELSGSKEIPWPSVLWKKRNVHDYRGYLQNRKLALAHALLLVKLETAHFEGVGHISEHWPSTMSYITLVCREFVNKHSEEVESLLINELFTFLGKLSASTTTDFIHLVKLIKYFPIPLPVVYLRNSYNRDDESKVLVQSEAKRKIEKHLYAMRERQLLSLALTANELKDWELCLMVFRDTPILNGKNTEEHFYRIYVSAIISSWDLKNGLVDKKDLFQALDVLEKYSHKFRFRLNQHYFILRAYVVSVLYNLEEIQYTRLKNEFLMLEQQESQDTPEVFAYIKSLVYLDVLDGAEKRQVDEIEYFEKLLTGAEKLEEVESTVRLMRIWLDRLSGKESDSQVLASLKQTIKGEKDSYPRTLWPIIENIREENT